MSTSGSGSFHFSFPLFLWLSFWEFLNGSIGDNETSFSMEFASHLRVYQVCFANRSHFMGISSTIHLLNNSQQVFHTLSFMNKVSRGHQLLPQNEIFIYTVGIYQILLHVTAKTTMFYQYLNIQKLHRFMSMFLHFLLNFLGEESHKKILKIQMHL